MGYLRRTSIYLEIMTLSDSTPMMTMVNIVAIDVKTLRLDNGSVLF